MQPNRRGLTAVATALLLIAPAFAQGDETSKLIPPQLSKDQRETLARFLAQHDKPERFVPQGAIIVDPQPGQATPPVEPPRGATIKQYTVQVTPHRSVPGQPEPTRVDVYYYRPNPEKGRPGITVKRTVDVATGDQVGPTEVHLNKHMPLARAEINEAVELAKEKLPALQALYQDRSKNTVRYEYLQMLISRKHEGNDPGDRVVRFVFAAKPREGQSPTPPLRIIVNLTKGVATIDTR